MDPGLIIFILAATTISIGFVNVAIIHYKTIYYVKNKYPKRWEEEIQYGMRSLYGGAIFSYFKDTDDPVIINNKKRFHSAISRLMLSAFVCFIVSLGYGLWFELMKRPYL